MQIEPTNSLNAGMATHCILNFIRSADVRTKNELSEHACMFRGRRTGSRFVLLPRGKSSFVIKNPPTPPVSQGVCGKYWLLSTTPLTREGADGRVAVCHPPPPRARCFAFGLLFDVILCSLVAPISGTVLPSFCIVRNEQHLLGDFRFTKSAAPNLVWKLRHTTSSLKTSA